MGKENSLGREFLTISEEMTEAWLNMLKSGQDRVYSGIRDEKELRELKKGKSSKAGREYIG